MTKQEFIDLVTTYFPTVKIVNIYGYDCELEYDFIPFPNASNHQLHFNLNDYNSNGELTIYDGYVQHYHYKTAKGYEKKLQYLSSLSLADLCEDLRIQRQH